MGADAFPTNVALLRNGAVLHPNWVGGHRVIVEAPLEKADPSIVLPSAFYPHPAGSLQVDHLEFLFAHRPGLVTRIGDHILLVPSVQAPALGDMLDLLAIPQLNPALIVRALDECHGVAHDLGFGYPDAQVSVQILDKEAAPIRAGIVTQQPLTELGRAGL